MGLTVAALISRLAALPPDLEVRLLVDVERLANGSTRVALAPVEHVYDTLEGALAGGGHYIDISGRSALCKLGDT